MENLDTIKNDLINIIAENDLTLGIDFGTTNSCLSVWYKNRSVIIPDINGDGVIPTIIEINQDKKIIGKEAYIRKDIFNKTNIISNSNTFTVYEIKKLLGKKYSDIDKKYIQILGYNIQPDINDNILIIDSNTNKSYYPEEIAAHLFMSFKIKAETFLSQKFLQPIVLTNVVVSVPANFNTYQRQIIKNSAEYSGLIVKRLINEPTAAAICYGLGKSNLTDEGIHIIVFDFGGGTLDVSLLNIADGVYEVLGSCGNNNLGGSDFDAKIMEYCIEQFATSLQIDIDILMGELETNILQKLKYLSEQAKIALSDNINTKIKIDKFYKNENLSVNINREDFNNICQNLIRIIIKPLVDVLDICELNKDNIDEIIMVGGMTKIPIVRHNVERFFNKDVNCSINPDNVVSIGASIHGYMIANNTNLQNKLLLIDRTSLSIGIETSGGIMDIIIPRGSIIPIKKTKKYSTDTDNEDSIDVKIYEGERKFTKNNYLIGDFILGGIEKQKRGLAEIQITFEIDTSAIIIIKAEDLDNPLNKKSIQISCNKQNLSVAQIEQIIANAKSMDQVDRIDRMKKESYMSLIDNSKKILENISSEYIKIPIEHKNEIYQNVTEILQWLEANVYDNIDADKYKELLHDYKINYSIYIMQQNGPLITLDDANDEETKGIEIYDDDTQAKKYADQIKYFRQIIDEYNNINKQLKIIVFMDKKSLQTFNVDDTLVELYKLFTSVDNYANAVLIDFFVKTDLTDDTVTNYCNQLYILDTNFKEKFNIFNDEFNMINKLINKINDKEDYFLNKLEFFQLQIDNLNFSHDCITSQNNNIQTTNLNLSNKYLNNKFEFDNIINTQNNLINTNHNNIITQYNYYIDEINKKLELIIEFQSLIYKMNSGYVDCENNKILDIIKILDNI